MISSLKLLMSCSTILLYDSPIRSCSSPPKPLAKVDHEESAGPQCRSKNSKEHKRIAEAEVVNHRHHSIAESKA